MSFKTFISYSAEDAEIVYRTWDILTRVGIKSYAFEKFPKPGEAISQSAMNAIRDCKCMIVFLTKTGVKSHWVNQEVGAGVALNKMIIPIREKGTEWKGFIAGNIEHIPYNPLKPDHTIYLLVRRLRGIFRLARNVPNGVVVKCGSCGNEFEVDLPSNNEVEKALEEKRNFTLSCPNGHAVEISAETLEPIWLQKKFMKTLFKKRIMRMIKLLAKLDYPSILVESISLIKNIR
jgi:hypothetical protein